MLIQLGPREGRQEQAGIQKDSRKGNTCDLSRLSLQTTPVVQEKRASISSVHQSPQHFRSTFQTEPCPEELSDWTWRSERHWGWCTLTSHCTHTTTRHPTATQTTDTGREQHNSPRLTPTSGTDQERTFPWLCSTHLSAGADCSLQLWVRRQEQQGNRDMS